MTETGSQYRHNHYVPKWYQRRFLPSGEPQFHYLDLNPEVCRRDGHTWIRRDLLRWGPDSCFAQDDLYTTRWGAITNTDIEQFFFGELDQSAQPAVDFFTNRGPRDIDSDAFQALIRYMSVQKLRTPKGLAWLRSVTRSLHPNFTLQQLQRVQGMFCATWADCVWQIASAAHSPTKFIVSDHPVTIYNRECFPGSAECVAPNDPDIRLVGSHTVFPLSLEKVLILTNLAWVRNPYQDARKVGPNDRLFRDAIFNFMDIQFDRFLTEEEVREINYIIKRRALRYVGAAEKDWLFPEKHLHTDHWRKLGDGYLLMPDPRHVYMGGTVHVGYKNGRAEAWGPYGHKPWEPAFEDQKRDRLEAATLLRFQSEWSATLGPKYRGLSYHFGGVQAVEVSENGHRHYVEIDERERRKPGERARRRRLRKV